jgi:D-alanine-D-alanine ligase
VSERPTVLVLMGGPDAERPVSIDSGTAVANALRAGDRLAVASATIDVVDPPALLELAARHDADVVFPVLHGTWGEGGPLQDVLETTGLPYVGSGPRASAWAMDKLATKETMRAAGVPTPEAVALEPGDACRLAPPLVLKPIDEGSSVDLRICRTTDEIEAARRVLHPRRGCLLAERYIEGRELTVGLLDDDVLPLIEIVPGVEFYDYAAKYERDDTRYVLSPALPAGVEEQCIAAATAAFRRLGCRDLARVDFMLDDAGAWFLEINTMPGFTDHSLVPMAARARGIEMPELCTRLAETALTRARPPAVPGPGF